MDSPHPLSAAVKAFMQRAFARGSRSTHSSGRPRRCRGHLPVDRTARQSERVARTLEQSSEEERRDYGVMKDKIRGDLKRFIQKNANRRPLIMPIILEL